MPEKLKEMDVFGIGTDENTIHRVKRIGGKLNQTTGTVYIVGQQALSACSLLCQTGWNRLIACKSAFKIDG